MFVAASVVWMLLHITLVIVCCSLVSYNSNVICVDGIHFRPTDFLY